MMAFYIYQNIKLKSFLTYLNIAIELFIHTVNVYKYSSRRDAVVCQRCLLRVNAMIHPPSPGGTTHFAKWFADPRRR
jgi:hypothetical protein